MRKITAYALFVGAFTCQLAHGSAAQERTYTWTLTQTEMNYIGALIDAEKAKPTGQLVEQLARKIQAQISQQEQAAQAAAVEGFRKQVEAEAKAKAESSDKKEPQ